MTAIRMNHAGDAVTGFRAWRRGRPLIGGALLVLSGLELFFSGQLDLGNIHVSLGVEGFQATVIPALMALLGVLAIVTPAQRIFYGIFALILAVYSIVGVNLGGFLLGMLLGAVGGVIVVAWRPKPIGDGNGDGGTGSTAAASVATAEPAAGAAAVADAVPESAKPAHRVAHGGAVHAEAVDYATLKARAEARRHGAGTARPTTPAEPRPFARSRS